MIAHLFFLTMQASQPMTQVVSDAPPALLWAGYDQWLNTEISQKGSGSRTPEAIFEASHEACDFWLDAYLEKIQQNLIATNVDFEQEKVKIVTSIREKMIPIIAERQAGSWHSKSPND